MKESLIVVLASPDGIGRLLSLREVAEQKHDAPDGIAIADGIEHARDGHLLAGRGRQQRGVVKETITRRHGAENVRR